MKWHVAVPALFAVEPDVEAHSAEDAVNAPTVWDNLLEAKLEEISDDPSVFRDDYAQAYVFPVDASAAPVRFALRLKWERVE